MSSERVAIHAGLVDVLQGNVGYPWADGVQCRRSVQHEQRVVSCNGQRRGNSVNTGTLSINDWKPAGLRPLGQ
jgi:hypothetical protein